MVVFHGIWNGFFSTIIFGYELPEGNGYELPEGDMNMDMNMHIN